MNACPDTNIHRSPSTSFQVQRQKHAFKHTHTATQASFGEFRVIKCAEEANLGSNTLRGKWKCLQGEWGSTRHSNKSRGLQLTLHEAPCAQKGDLGCESRCCRLEREPAKWQNTGTSTKPPWADRCCSEETQKYLNETSPTTKKKTAHHIHLLFPPQINTYTAARSGVKWTSRMAPGCLLNGLWGGKFCLPRSLNISNSSAQQQATSRWCWHQCVISVFKNNCILVTPRFITICMLCNMVKLQPLSSLEFKARKENISGRTGVW